MFSLRPILMAVCFMGVSWMVLPASQAQNSVSLESKAVVRTFMEALYLRNDLETAEGLLAENFLENSPVNQPLPPAEAAASNTVLQAPEPLVTFTLEQVLGEGDFVMTLLRVEEFGRVPYYFLDLFRVENGLIVEHWDGSPPTDPQTSSQNQPPPRKPSVFGKPKPKPMGFLGLGFF